MKLTDLLVYNLLGFFGLQRALGQICLNDLLKMVNCKEVSIFNIVNFGIYVTRHGYVNEENRL